MRRWLFFAVLACGLIAPPAQAGVDVVPADQRISDARARLQLARLYTWSGRPARAVALYKRLIAAEPGDAGLHAGLAEAELALGHAAACRDGFARALALDPGNQDLLLRQAQAMNLWGDFYRMERIYRAYLDSHPRDAKVRLALARLLESAMRFEQAGGLYRRLMAGGELSPADGQAALCRLGWESGDLAACLAHGQKALALDPDRAGVLELMGKASLRLGRGRKAMGYFTRLAARPGHETAGLLGMARAAGAMGQADRARALLQNALAADPEDIDARIAALGDDTGAAARLAAGLIATGGPGPAKLARWARAFAEHGLYAQAAACHRAALTADPAYFPSRLGLAEVLGVDKHYQEANRLLASLAGEYPGVFKVLITRARVLAWSRQYEKALALYGGLHRLNPADPVPLREAARTAAWAKDMARARELYQAMTRPPLDAALAKRLPGGVPEAPGPVGGYERLLASPQGRVKNAAVLGDLWPEYRVQKSALMELAGKERLWQRRFLPAMRQFRELTGFMPGNQEAWFDLAQAQCALGLCDRERDSYRQLLARDPLHGLARRALARQERRAAPRLGAEYGRWQENGYGERAQITRQRAELQARAPLLCRLGVEAAAIHWWEMPTRYAGEARAFGWRLGGGGPLTPWLRAEGSWTHKDYRDDGLGGRDGGSLQAWLDACGYLKLGLGWEREEVLANAFALRQGIMADTWWLGLESQISHRLEASLRLRYLDYNDGNKGQWENLRLGYDLTEHPHRLTLWMNLERRDHDEGTTELYRNGALTDMVHPYWAPQNWTGGALGLRWRQDLAGLLFCGEQQHYYELGLSVSDDSDSNPGWQAEAAWRYEFAGRWDATVRGLLHRSRQWDANGLWLSLGCRF